MDYTIDKIRPIDAKFEAQKISFSPLLFQAVRALLDLGILKAVSDAGEEGLTRSDAAQKTGVSLYGTGVLLEAAMAAHIVILKSGPGEERFVLGKTGYFLLEDDLTKANFNFVNDICYKGAFELCESIRSGKPRGLTVFGDKWDTIYQALSSLPEKEKKSWFDFDNFYSDIGFPEALPIVFAEKPKKILDIGGNNAKWAIGCCRYDPDVEVIIADLSGQASLAEKNAASAGFPGRIKAIPCDALDKADLFPRGADAVWMSQFLDCFSPEEITGILEKIKKSSGENTDVFVFEPLWDKQRFEAAVFSLLATSLYFTCMANGNSKMYRYGELVTAIEKAGFTLSKAHHNLGMHDYSLLHFRRNP
jgi:hypothetical protein